ncbi:Lrp/AsnC family transcriptional regulator [Enterococcus gilvus]|jgi:Lrp/AsnC family transcriptional regulator, leucine-responsive regulatory protein|uniref:Lrp/AsnC family transcriptional regulator n=1 Tax=Enterococcus gilvus TaxID=160453 RepID=UPI000DF619D1|nr:Lrp/AsnC family transcriptional regulator [Enterococcus gilvus]AXG38453.1 Lrp/AsnC family transcriptional regulator [Enterococcus gilvus]
MDKHDLEILDILKKDSRMSARQISELAGLTAPAVTERIRKLESNGTIKQYTIKKDRRSCGRSILAFTLVKIDRTGNTSNFKNTLTKYPSVLECHNVTGAYDYLLKIEAADIPGLETFLSTKVKQVRGVGETQTLITLDSLKEEANG